MARYLSRAELSCIADKYIEMYYALFGISKNDPAPINPEQFANSVLGLNLKMLPLCSDGHILGLTVFQRCSFTATLEDAHILDDDRRLNAQRFDDFFYRHQGAEPEMPHQTAQPIPENSAVDADAAAALTKLLANPSMAELIKNLAKNL